MASSKVIIFDFDGTLADSTQIMHISYNRVAKFLRCKPILIEELMHIRSLHFSQILRKLNISYFKLPLVIFFTLRLYKQQIHQLQAYPGTIDMLKQLHAANYKLCIVSSNKVSIIKQFLALRDIPYFTEIYSSGRHVFAKSKMITKILHDNNIAPKHAYYIGDELRDIDAGHQAQIKVVAVSWGSTERAALHAQADHIIDNPAELLAYISDPECKS